MAMGKARGKGHGARGEEVCLVYLVCLVGRTGTPTRRDAGMVHLVGLVCLVYLVCFVHRTKETTQTRETNVKWLYY